MAKAKNPQSITGRDGYIVNKALLYAIAEIQHLPQELQEWSDMQNMCMIARTMPFTMHQMQSVEHHSGKTFTLWPEPDDELTPAERGQRDEFVTRYAEWKGTMEKNFAFLMELSALRNEEAA